MCWSKAESTHKNHLDHLLNWLTLFRPVKELLNRCNRCRWMYHRNDKRLYSTSDTHTNNMKRVLHINRQPSLNHSYRMFFLIKLLQIHNQHCGFKCHNKSHEYKKRKQEK